MPEKKFIQCYHHWPPINKYYASQGRGQKQVT